MTCGVYSLSFGGGDFYIGSSRNIERRVARHRQAIAKGSHVNVILKAATAKHGSPKCHLLIVCREAELLLYEQAAIDALHPRYNLSKKAGKVVLSEESRLWQRQRIQEAWLRPETRECHRKGIKARDANPDNRKIHAEAMRRRDGNPQWRAALKAGIAKRTADPDWKANNLKALAALQSPEVKKRARAEWNRRAQERRSARPPKRSFAEYIAQRSADPEWQAAIAERNRLMSSDPGWRSKVLEAQRARRARERAAASFELTGGRQ